jgi:hypothetical protein
MLCVESGVQIEGSQEDEEQNRLPQATAVGHSWSSKVSRLLSQLWPTDQGPVRDSASLRVLGQRPSIDEPREHRFTLRMLWCVPTLFQQLGSTPSR